MPTSSRPPASAPSARPLAETRHFCVERDLVSDGGARRATAYRDWYDADFPMEAPPRVRPRLTPADD